VADTAGIPFDDDVDADACIGIEALPIVELALMCDGVSAELGNEPGDRAYRSSKLPLDTTELPVVERYDVPRGAAERLAPVLARLLVSRVADEPASGLIGCDCDMAESDADALHSYEGSLCPRLHALVQVRASQPAQGSGPSGRRGFG
jgi:hypothetical protein